MRLLIFDYYFIDDRTGRKIGTWPATLIDLMKTLKKTTIPDNMMTCVLGSVIMTLDIKKIMLGKALLKSNSR
jgi:hypothetical protein